MKTFYVRVIVILACIILGAYLFVTGKQHTVLITNTGNRAIKKSYYYILDGQKKVHLKINKKKRAYIKGVTHTLEVKIKNSDKSQKNIVKIFKVGLNEKLTINIANIEKGDTWLEKK